MSLLNGSSKEPAPGPLCHRSAPCPIGSSACDFTEAAFWAKVEGGWQCLYGSYCHVGLSIEWHEFTCDGPREWSESFHPEAVEVCLNLSGRAELVSGKERIEVGPRSIAMYIGTPSRLSARRFPGEQHRFLTIEFSKTFLARHFRGSEPELHPLVRRGLAGSGRGPCASRDGELSPALQRAIEEMRQPWLRGSALEKWYEAQALGVAAQVFFSKSSGTPAPRSRKEQVAQDRVNRTIQVLGRDLANPPALAELGKVVGCSPFYLSRTFSSHMGMTIPQYIRKIRMERAAELLKSGAYNVTEAAMQVGYSSLSHFSQAFCDVMGCCPGLYPLGLSRSRLLGTVQEPGMPQAES